MIRAVIFDLDGTLVHIDREFRRNLVSKVLNEFNVAVPEYELDEFWFMHSRGIMVEKWGLDTEEFWKVFYKMDDPKERMAHTSVFDDIDYLKRLKQENIRIALFTSAREGIAKESIKLVGRELFDAVIVAEPFNDIQLKPHPEGVEKCLRLLKTDKEETIYVGNSDEDILTAKNAGIFSVLIDRKEHKHDLKPDRRIESLYELDKIIFSLENP